MKTDAELREEQSKFYKIRDKLRELAAIYNKMGDDCSHEIYRNQLIRAKETRNDQT